MSTEDTIASLNAEIETLRAQANFDRINYEQRLVELESGYISSKSQLESINAEYENLKIKYHESTKKNEELLNEKQNLSNLALSKEGDVLRLTKRVSELENEKNNANELASSRYTQISNLEKNVAILNGKIDTLISEKETINRNHKISESSKRDLQVDIETKDQEIASLRKQITYLNNEFNKKVEEIVVIQKQKNELLSKTTTEKEKALAEAETYRNLSENFKKTGIEKDNKINELMKLTKDLREQKVKGEEQSKQEFDTQKRLTELYKEHQEAFEKRAKKLETELELYQQMNHQRENNELEIRTKLEQKINTLTQELSEEREKIETLSKQLEESKNYPGISSEVALGLSESMRKTMENVFRNGKLDDVKHELAQMVHRYQEIYSLYLNEKAASRNLKVTLDHILKEVEQRTPMILEQRNEYEKRLQASEKMNSTLREKDTLIDRLSTENSQLEQSNDLLKSEIRDLSLQVRTLLQECMTIQPNSRILNVSSHMVGGTATSLIPSTLITFRNIEELQIKNQELLQFIRELQAKLEVETGKQTSQQLNLALSKLEQFERQREKQNELVQTLIRQRDSYKYLVKQQEGSSQASVAPPRAFVSEEEYQKLLKIQYEFEDYKKERSEHDMRQNEVMSRVKDEASNERITSTKLRTENLFLNDRLTHLQENLQSTLSESNKNKATINEYMATIISNQNRMEEAQANSMKAQEKAKILEIQLTSTRNDLNLLKKVQEQKSKELDETRRELSKYEGLYLSLQQSHQVSLNNEQKAQDLLATEIKALQTKLNDEIEEGKERENELEEELKTLRKESQINIDKLSLMKEESFQKQVQIQSLEGQIKSLKDDLSRASQNIGTSQLTNKNIQQSAINIDEKSRLEVELNLVKSELQSLQEELKMEKDNHRSQRELYEATEENLRNLRKSSAELEESFIARISELEKGIAQKSSDHAKVVEELQTLQEKLQEVESVMKTKEDEIRKLNQSLVDAKENERKATSMCVALQNDWDLLQEKNKQSHDNYQRVVISHADDVKTLQKATTELTEISKQLEQEKMRVQTLEVELRTKEGSFNEQSAILSQRITDLENSNQSLSQSNALLHATVESLSKQNNPNNLEPNSSAETVQNLTEVHVFLRRENSILSNRLQSAEQETDRIKTQLKNVQELLEETNTRLHVLQSKQSLNIMTEAEHKMLLEDVKNLKLYKESNELLRNTAEDRMKQITTLNTKLNELQTENAKFKAEKNSLLVEFESLKAQKQAIQIEADETNVRIQRILSKYNNIDPDQYKKEYAEKEENFRKQVAEKDQVLKEKDEKIATLEKDLGTQKEIVGKQKALINNKKKTIEELSTQASTLSNQTVPKTEVEKLNNQITTQKIEIEKLNTQNHNQKTEIVNLNNQITTLQNQTNTLSSEITKLNQQTTLLKEEIEKKNKVIPLMKKLQEQNEVLKKDKASLQGEKSNLENEKAKLTDELKIKSTELSSASMRIALLSSKSKTPAKSPFAHLNPANRVLSINPNNNNNTNNPTTNTTVSPPIVSNVVVPTSPMTNNIPPTPPNTPAPFDEQNSTPKNESENVSKKPKPNIEKEITPPPIITEIQTSITQQPQTTTTTTNQETQDSNKEKSEVQNVTGSTLIASPLISDLPFTTPPIQTEPTIETPTPNLTTPTPTPTPFTFSFGTPTNSVFNQSIFSVPATPPTSSFFSAPPIPSLSVFQNTPPSFSVFTTTTTTTTSTETSTLDVSSIDQIDESAVQDDDETDDTDEEKSPQEHHLEEEDITEGRDDEDEDEHENHDEDTDEGENLIDGESQEEEEKEEKEEEKETGTKRIRENEEDESSEKRLKIPDLTETKLEEDVLTEGDENLYSPLPTTPNATLDESEFLSEKTQHDEKTPQEHHEAIVEEASTLIEPKIETIVTEATPTPIRENVSAPVDSTTSKLNLKRTPAQSQSSETPATITSTPPVQSAPVPKRVIKLPKTGTKETNPIQTNITTPSTSTTLGGPTSINLPTTTTTTTAPPQTQQAPQKGPLASLKKLNTMRGGKGTGRGAGRGK